MKVDVCIIGGGPAGSTLALRLAQLGHKVCVVEREGFPREHMGESLSPGIWTQLDMLGAREAVDAMGFTPCREITLHWYGANPERRDQSQQPGLLVDRGRFDHLLLRMAQAHGVHVLQPASLTACERQGEGWRLTVNGRVVETTLLADASGGGVVLRGPRRLNGPRTLAISAYWQGASLAKAPRIEAGREAWFWAVPLPNGTTNAMAFVDTAYFRARRTGSIAQEYDRLIAQSGLVAGCADARKCHGVQVCDATPSVSLDAISSKHIKVGGAALVIDPLSSSGVQKAMQTALSGAIAVNTVLRRPGDAAQAVSFYQANILASAERHRRWAAEFYQTAAAHNPTAFWHARAAAPEAPSAAAPPDLGPGLHARAVKLSPHIRWVDVPCIMGEFVETRAGLLHPGLEQPAAFFAGHELAPLLRAAPMGATTPLALARQWSAVIPERTALGLTGWLLGLGALMPC
ncbi:MAG: tryptophan 7-halogenase [Rhodospirillaceae bacterium]|nr:tryptophan 7-halogenase [Rhodospirillales bacterium]